MRNVTIDTKILLCCISLADIIWGTGGGVTLFLWIGYGMYKKY